MSALHDVLRSLCTCNEGFLGQLSPCALLAAGTGELTDICISCENAGFSLGGEQGVFLPLGTLLVTWTLLLSEKLYTTQSTIWLALQSPVVPGEECWASCCKILPLGSLHLSVPTVVSALCWLPSDLGHSLFFWDWRTVKDHWGYQDCSAVTL